jgi:hypothetical protein
MITQCMQSTAASDRDIPNERGGAALPDGTREKSRFEGTDEHNKAVGHS